VRISFKLLGISEAVLLVAIIALLIPLFSQMHAQIVEQMQTELKSIARNAAPLLDGDLHELVAAGGPEAGAAFEVLKERLVRIRDLNQVNYEHIYTFYRDGDQVRFGVMTHPGDGFTGDPWDMQPGMVAVFEKGTVEATDLYMDDKDDWISAFAPIRNGDGNVVGLLEVDFPASVYLVRFRELTRIVILSVLAAIAISSLLGWRVLDALVIRPMRKIRAGVVALGKQNFDHRVDLTTRDEFQELGETLNGLSKQLNAAHVVQSSFHPKQMPELPGLRVAGLSAACDAAGGDYFDAFELPGGKLAMVVGDVSGHGLGPALLMATCRAGLRALAAEDVAPGDLIQHLDRLLTQDLASGRFITMIYAVLEPDGSFTYSNAGHGPALIVRDGAVEHLGPHRTPLGVHLYLTLDKLQTTIMLAPGDRVLFASDGLTEAMDADGKMLGIEPLERWVTTPGIDCETIVIRLEDAVLQHCQGPSRTDDVTILCVDRLAITTEETDA